MMLSKNLLKNCTFLKLLILHCDEVWRLGNQGIVKSLKNLFVLMRLLLYKFCPFAQQFLCNFQCIFCRVVE